MKKTLIVIGGPTAIGKTKMAIKLAKKWQSEIISSDARQFYKELNIGVGKPSQSNMSRLHNLRPGDEHRNATDARARALKMLKEQMGKDKIKKEEREAQEKIWEEEQRLKEEEEVLYF